MQSGQRLAFQSRRRYVPRRLVVDEEPRTSVIRYGRRWEWDMTVNLPLPVIEQVFQESEKDIQINLTKQIVKLLKIEEKKLQVELVQTPYENVEKHLEKDQADSLGSASVLIDGQPVHCIQLVLWSQWSKFASTKKVPSWIEEPPPRNTPRPARNYLATISLPAILAIYRHREQVRKKVKSEENVKASKR